MRFGAAPVLTPANARASLRQYAGHDERRDQHADEALAGDEAGRHGHDVSGANFTDVLTCAKCNGSKVVVYVQAKDAVRTIDPRARDRALAVLRSIDGRVQALGASPEGSAHPIVAGGLPGFAAAIVEARSALQRDPPDPDPARELSRSCRSCHALAARRAPSSTQLATTGRRDGAGAREQVVAFAWR